LPIQREGWPDRLAVTDVRKILMLCELAGARPGPYLRPAWTAGRDHQSPATFRERHRSISCVRQAQVITHGAKYSYLAHPENQ
jgi:hypothetical protein